MNDTLENVMKRFFLGCCNGCRVLIQEITNKRPVNDEDEIKCPHCRTGRLLLLPRSDEV